MATQGWVLGALLTLSGVACTRPRTEVVVVLSTDYAWGPGQPLRAVQVQVRSISPTGPLRDLHVYPLGAAGRYAMPASFGITPLSDEHGTLWIEASGCADLECAVVLTRQRALTGFAAGETVVLPMFLARACESVTCDNPLQTCRPSDRSCASAQVDVTMLARFGSDAGAGPNVDASFPDVIDAGAGPHVDAPFPDVTDAGAGPNMDASFPDETAACLSGQEMCGGACRDLRSDRDHCGTCGHDCAAEEHCAAAVCGPLPPRLIAPLSTATVTSRRPTLHWALARGTDGTAVEICRDRACTVVVTTFTAEGDHGAPAMELPTGVLFWRARGRTAGATRTGVSPTWQFTVGARTAPVDTSWGTTADFNGDGYADVVVGAYRVNTAYVYRGSASGLATSPVVSLRNPGGLERDFGESVASAGDVNGDGYADLVVGIASGMASTGVAYIYLGGDDGPSAVHSALVVGPDGPDGYFGGSVASGGDVNGDGYADLVVGAVGPLARTGRAYVYLGSASGLVPTPARTFTGPDGVGGYFGTSVASAGDVNGDGYADLVVGGSSVLSSTGRAYVYLGSADGPTDSPTTAFTGRDTGGIFGASVAGAGDVNGDGYADLVVGAPFVMSAIGRSYVYLGGASGLATKPATTLVGLGRRSDFFGGSVASAGDINRDGYADLVVGSHEVQGSGGGTGRAYIFMGSADGLDATPATTLTGEHAGDYFGEQVANAGDVNGDGYADLVVGASLWMASVGRAYLYLGSASGLVTTTVTTLTGPDGARGRFGATVAGIGSFPLVGVGRCAVAPAGRNRTARRSLRGWGQSS